MEPSRERSEPLRKRDTPRTYMSLITQICCADLLCRLVTQIEIRNPRIRAPLNLA